MVRFRYLVAGAIFLTLAGAGLSRGSTVQVADLPPGGILAPAEPIAIDPPQPAQQAEACGAAEFLNAAANNARSLKTLAFSPFGRAERGWEIYAPKIAQEVDTVCEPDTSGFARALAQWQSVHGLLADGQVSTALFMTMKTAWQDERPFVAVRAKGVCPDAPSEATLTRLNPDEGYKGKAIMLRSDVAEAYRKMVAAARAEAPGLAADPEALTVFSGYRSPAYDAARCARDNNCQGVTRASCSAHRTAFAFDLVVGAAPGSSVDSTQDANRLHQSQTPAYRWMIANAERFGFVNYVFEPWHWEYRGGAD